MVANDLKGRRLSREVMPSPEESQVGGKQWDAVTRGSVVLEGVTPILRVQDLSISIDYYSRVLGFKVDWQEPGVIASVSRDRCCIMLCEGDQGSPGAKIRHPPTNYTWAYEMQIEDPDRNVLRFGSEPKPDKPFGEWLDMRGEAWTMLPNGGWRRVRDS